MMIVTRAAISMGLCPRSALEELNKILVSTGLPTECPYGARELTEIALADKKRKGGSITLVLPYSIGDSRLYKISVDELENFIDRGLGK